MVSFKVASDEIDTISKIVDRAMELYRRHGHRPNRMTVHMDVTATHANGCALRLAELLEADDFNFAHDLYGIDRHLDRNTGKLTDHFLPRFAA